MPSDDATKQDLPEPTPTRYKYKHYNMKKTAPPYIVHSPQVHEPHTSANPPNLNGINNNWWDWTDPSQVHKLTLITFTLHIMLMYLSSHQVHCEIQIFNP